MIAPVSVVIPVATVDECGKDLIHPVAAHDLKWVLDKNGSSEAMTFYVHYEDESFAYIQFAYSSVG